MPDGQALKMMHMASKSFCKNSSKTNKFLHSEVNLLIQHIIVQDQDGQNNKNNNIDLIEITRHHVNYIILSGTPSVKQLKGANLSKKM